MATLINNQAAFLARQSEADQRFARIERDMATIIRTLDEHTRTLNHLLPELLEKLPAALGAKFGFQPPNRA